MEAVCERGNLWLAYERVIQNKGAAGVDGIGVAEFKDHLKRHWPTIKANLLAFERGFKVIKSEIEIGPIYHRLPDRIRAHAQICFIALILHRVIRSRLKAASIGLSPDRALKQLTRIQHHRIQIAQSDP